MPFPSIKEDTPVCVALTGATGFVGSYILEQLLEAGFDVKVLQHRTKFSTHENLKVISGSFDDFDSLKIFVKGATHIIHCGGAVATRKRSEFAQINTQGTNHLIKAAEQAGNPYFLYISSMAARMPELSPYAASKRAGEEILQGSQLSKWDIMRPPAIYGPGDSQLLPLIRLLKYRIALLPAGKQARASVIYVEDIARAVHSWLLSKGNNMKNSIYEIDDSQKDGYAWQSLLEKTAKIMDIKPHYMKPPGFLMMAVGYIVKIGSQITRKAPFLTPDKLRELAHPDWVRQNEGFEEAFNWRPQVTFEEGITNTLSWYKQKGML